MYNGPKFVLDVALRNSSQLLEQLKKGMTPVSLSEAEAFSIPGTEKDLTTMLALWTSSSNQKRPSIAHLQQSYCFQNRHHRLQSSH